MVKSNNTRVLILDICTKQIYQYRQEVDDLCMCPEVLRYI